MEKARSPERYEYRSFCHLSLVTSAPLFYVYPVPVSEASVTRRKPSRVISYLDLCKRSRLNSKLYQI
jgi:hypothetical protein